MIEPFVVFERPTVCVEFSVWERTAAVPAAGIRNDGEEFDLRM